MRHQSYAHAARAAQGQPLGPSQAKTSHQKQQPQNVPPATGSTLSLDFSKVPALDLTLPSSASNSSLSSPTTAKPSPDRYRRNVRRAESSESGPHRAPQSSAIPSGSGMAAVGQLYNHPAQASSSPSLSQKQSYRGSTYSQSSQPSNASADDMMLGRSQNADLAARYRRRSLGSLETTGIVHAKDAQDGASPHPNAFIASQAPQLPPVQTQRPSSAHAHTGSSDSVASSKSARSSRPPSVCSSLTYQIPFLTQNRLAMTATSKPHKQPLPNRTFSTLQSRIFDCSVPLPDQTQPSGLPLPYPNPSTSIPVMSENL